MRTRRTLVTRLCTAAAYLLSVVLANYSITHIGYGPVAPGAPYTLPVWPGIEAPSGVYVVGLTLVLRDLVQRQSGKRATLWLILAATSLTWLISPSLAVASTLAFLVSETVDFAVFTALQRTSVLGAVAASNAVSIVVDSVMFLWLAGFGFAFLDGQIIGKVFGTLLGIAVLAALQVRESRRSAAA
jgi:uncharacterized PurR-regulated membrane protein YhhQ (DUF165 family)